MRRRLFNIASVVSLLLCVGAAALWLRSYFCIDYVRYSGEQNRLIILNGDGGVHLLLMQFQASKLQFALTHEVFHDADLSFSGSLAYSVYTIGYDGVSVPVGEMPILIPRFQREKNQSSLAGTYNSIWIGFRHWMPLLVFAILPAFTAGRSFRRRSKTIRGLCPTCFYNLTANTSGICPECGTPFVRRSDK